MVGVSAVAGTLLGTVVGGFIGIVGTLLQGRQQRNLLPEELKRDRMKSALNSQDEALLEVAKVLSDFDYELRRLLEESDNQGEFDVGAASEKANDARHSIVAAWEEASPKIVDRTQFARLYQELEMALWNAADYDSIWGDELLPQTQKAVDKSGAFLDALSASRAKVPAWMKDELTRPNRFWLFISRRFRAGGTKAFPPPAA